MNWRDHIVSDPDTLFGRPRIKGTRIGVDFVLELLAYGWSEAQILENYPHLKEEDLQAVFWLVPKLQLGNAALEAPASISA